MLDAVESRRFTRSGVTAWSGPVTDPVGVELRSMIAKIAAIA